MYLKRKIDRDLVEWSRQKEGKPLLIRGARQVGKSTAVRRLGQYFDHFLEINFEEQRSVHALFEGDLDPVSLCENLSILYNVPIIAGKTLLFFDEIQACIPAISSLRFFYEKYASLHVIAAGSLLEFALSEIPSFGVGRIRSVFLYPMSFEEYLEALGEKNLAAALQKASPYNPLASPVHQKAVQHLKRFLVLGGMPEVVAHYAETRNLQECGLILDDLITSFRADFVKYKQHVPSARISEVFESVVHQAGGKFVYSRAATEANHKQVKEATELLIKAGLIIPVTHSSANGLPLGAESNPKKQKMLLLDTGLFQRILGLNLAEIILENDFNLINRGAIAEQFAGLELLKSFSCYRQERLYYWHRESKSSNAEVDYLIQKASKIVPLEVKSGSKGSMQSLYLFMKEKNIPLGIRMSLEPFGMMDGVYLYPLYAVSNLVNADIV